MIFEHWTSDENGDTFFSTEMPNKMKLLPEDARKCCEIEADSWNEAMQLYSTHMGFDTYDNPRQAALDAVAFAEELQQVNDLTEQIKFNSTFFRRLGNALLVALKMPQMTIVTHDNPRQTTIMTPEQQARDILERCGMTNAQELSAGDVVELANILNNVITLKACLREVIKEIEFVPDRWPNIKKILE